MENEAARCQRTEPMKRVGQNNKRGAAKRHKAKQPPASPAASSNANSTSCATYTAVASTGLTQQHMPSTSATAPSVFFSAVVLDNADILGLVASLLSYRGLLHGSELDNSLLHFALCSRRTHSLVMADGPWWRQRRLHVNLRRPLISPKRWTLIDERRVAVMVGGFPVRQQEVMRRLLGDEDYDQEVAPALTSIASVPYNGICWSVGEGMAKSDEERASTVADGSEVEVYRKLDPYFLEQLTDFLPYWGTVAVEVENDPETVCSDSDGEPGNPWLAGCYDALLLPTCVQWIAAASITLNLAPGLPHTWQSACLRLTLGLLPRLTQLALTWNGKISRWTQQPLLTDLTDVLPKLTSLHLSRVPLSKVSMIALIGTSRLQRLRLDQTPMSNFEPPYEEDSTTCKATGRCFSYPAKWSEAVQMSGETAVDERAKRAANFRLRLALCAHFIEELEECDEESEYGRELKHVRRMLKKCREVQQQVQAEAAGKKQSGDDDQ